jgi:hypothetical protein
MKLPSYVYAKAFWEAVSYVVAGVLALLVYFGVLPTDYLYSVGAVLTGLLGVLRFFRITPELKAKGLR